MMNGRFGCGQDYSCGIYCRLSKEDGDKLESDSIAHQRELLENYCNQQGWRIYSIYQDDGYTGLNQDRPEFQRMIRDIEARRINLVITKDYSRLGRNHIETSKLTEEYFPRRGVRYIALNDGIDTEQENEIMPFKGLLNEMYSKDVSKKVHSSYLLQANKGVYTGVVPPFGYLKDPEQKGHLIIDPETAPIARYIFELAASGKGTASISRVLEREKIPRPTWWNRQRGFRNHTTKWEKKDPVNGQYIWDVTVLKDMLINPAYYGAIASQKKVYRFKLGILREKTPEEWIVVEDCHESIVDKATFLLVQERIKSRKRVTRQGELSLFAGLLKCGECGKSLCLTYENSKEHPRVYCCKTYNRYGAHHCTRHRVRYDELSDIVLEQIHTLGAAALRDREAVLLALRAQTSDEYAQRRGALQKRILDAEERLEVLERLVTRLYDDLTAGRITDENFLSVMNRTQEEQKALREKLVSIRSELDGLENPETDDDEWVSLIAQYANIQELDAELLNRIVKKIVVYEQDGTKKLEIYFNARSLPELHDVG